MLSPLPEWPSCEELIPPTAYTRSDGAEVMNSWWSRKTTERFKAVSFTTLLADLPKVGRTHAHPVQFSKAETHDLIARSRREEASLHGVLLAALMFSLVTEATTFRASHPFDLRAELQPPVGEDLGLFIASLWTVHNVSPVSHFWDVARDVTRQILAVIARGAYFDAALQVRQSLAPSSVPDAHLWASSTLVRRWTQSLAPSSVLDVHTRRRTVTVSDLGQLPIPACYGALELRELFITGFIPAQIPVLSTCMLGECLSFLVNHSESWRSAAEGKAFSHTMARTLVRAVAAT
jgi:hypothetical protein